MGKLILSSSKNKRDHFILLKDEDGERDIARLSFFGEPFLTEGFAEYLGSAIMHEIREQIIAYSEGASYERNPTPFDKKKAKRIADKIISKLAGDPDGY